MVKTVKDNDFKLVKSDKDFTYQNELTTKLDSNTNLFNQDIINEIVLWKVNRYAKLDDETLLLINEIENDSTELDIEKTKDILKKLLLTKGIQLPMASTILRFRNKNIYQIIDQRVFRIIYQDKTLKISTYPSEKNIKVQIDIYLNYLSELRILCQKLQISFCDADRILYMADKRINVSHKLNNY